MKGNKKTNEAHVLGKTERDASGEWTLRTQTGAIVAVVGAVVILLSHYPIIFISSKNNTSFQFVPHPSSTRFSLPGHIF